MHIKNIEICGFKSYKDQAGVEEFSPGHNTVVGRNGSGKSNFFRAIQFVLCEKGFTGLSHKERTEMLHEGAGSNVMTAYVQMVFDNSDGRFPMDAEEITLRRTIGLKKDEYFLNNKNFSKSDVINLLESAGFSRSNPYYIVQQGKVNALCLMKDEQRLQLLKAVAGTTVYEDRRKASEAIMAESNKKREKIEESVSDLEGRLNKLNEEKEELNEFRVLDRQRRALEYTLYTKELDKATRSLELLDTRRAEEVDKSNNLSKEIMQAREKLEESKTELKTTEQQLKSLEQDKTSIAHERAGLLKEKAKVELKVKDLEERKSTLLEQVQSSSKEMKTIETKITSIENQIKAETLPAYEKAKSQHERVSKTYNECERTIQELQAKQGRSRQFETQEERDQWLSSEIAKIKKEMTAKQGTHNEMEATMRKDETLKASLLRDLKESEEELEEQKRMLSTAEKDIASLKNERTELTGERKELWRKLELMEAETVNLRDEVQQSERGLKRAMPHRVASGLEAVEQIAKERGLSGVYGPLYKLIQPEDSVYNTAIEVAAGQSLTHVVVDTDQTASILIKELQRRKAGRVTFKPLNRIDERFRASENPDAVHDIKNLPEEPTTDVLPLISKVTFKPVLKNAIRAVLGKILLCRNQQIATEFSARCGVNCVTLDGDEVNRHGALTGGYHDSRNSKLLAVETIKAAKKKLDASEEEKNKLKRVEQQLDQRITLSITKIDKQNAQCNHMRNTANLLNDEVQQKRKQLDHTEEAIKVQTASINSNETGMNQLNLKLKALQAELESPMLENLSRDEQATLQASRAKLSEMSNSKAESEQLYESAKTKLNELQNELQTNLYRRRDELHEIIAKAGDDDIISDDSLTRELEAAQESLNSLTDRLQGSKSAQLEADEGISNLNKRTRELADLVEELKKQEDNDTEELQQCEERIEKILTKRALEKEHISRSSQEIRELGSLPALELEKIKDYSIKKLMSELRKVNESVKKYSHVNKKAMDQFVNFSDKRENLLKRKAELDEGQKQIESLIRHLDRQKDEAIMRTFRGVAKNFREVFKELVPHGRGELVMVTGKSKQKSSESSSSSTDAEQQVDEFVGVSPRVSFTGAGEVCRMRQLSGGQRALVALTLIFAIQRCDPAPFYLFDEIDQALDANHRAAVAALIKRQAASKENPTQFITTTFRSELVQVADKCYGIQFQNKISSMVLLKKKEAVEFIKNIAEEEGGEPTNSSAKKRKASPPNSDASLADSPLSKHSSKTMATAASSRKRIQAAS